jgi:DNA transformation protein
MGVSQGFTDFVVEQLEGCGVISTKRMFGGVGIYCGELFFALIDDDVLYLKVDDVNRPDFVRAGSGPFRPYGDDRESMQYYAVPAAVLEDAGELEKWGRKAIAAAQRKATKPKKRGRGSTTS